MYAAERDDARALDELEGVVREFAEELATWRARALKAEADLKSASGGIGGPAGAGGAGGRARAEGEGRGAAMELEVENRALRQRVDAARARIAALVARLSFLEEQTRAAVGGNGGAR